MRPRSGHCLEGECWSLMITRLAVLTLCLALFLSPALAQTRKAASRPTQKIKTIWDYDKELGMSPEQVQKLKDALTQLQNQLNTLKGTWVSQEKELKALLEKNAPEPQIKAKLQQIAATQVDMRMADVQTSRQVNAVLSADQMARWRDIQARARASGAAPAGAAAPAPAARRGK
jgi:septal ring factor EnvC (AmiA/AmiB activator)